MSSPISKERYEVPSPKRQKLEETTYDDDRRSDSDYYEEALEIFNAELDKHDGYEIDFSKYRYTFGWEAFDLDDSTMVNEPETNRDLISLLAKQALSQGNVDQENVWRWGRL